MVKMHRRTPKFEIVEKWLPETGRGSINREVNRIASLLATNAGYWVKIHRDYLPPGYLYRYNKGLGVLDQRITLRGVAAVKRGDEDFYYAMMLPGGVVRTIE